LILLVLLNGSDYVYGALLGDMIGVPYEFDRGNKSKNFELFNDEVAFSDDSVMTIAIAEALMEAGENANEETAKEELIMHMIAWGKQYPYAGYGARFINWFNNPVPYFSYGNGSAMRVSSVGWMYDSLERTREVARWTSKVSHDHPEGIKGAESVASAIYMARNGNTKGEIREYIISEFGYDLSRTCDEIRPAYRHVESCQETVPEAITAFLEGKDFEDVIRTAVSLGGDCDTLTCIAGSIAEAFYGVPDSMIAECRKRLDPEMIEVLDKFVQSQFLHKAGWKSVVHLP
jgi:ADP-ribosylglycohydrolase